METARSIATVRSHEEVFLVEVIFDTAEDTACGIFSHRSITATSVDCIIDSPLIGVIEIITDSLYQLVIEVVALITDHNAGVMFLSECSLILGETLEVESAQTRLNLNG